LFVSNIPRNAEDLVEVGGHDGKRLEGKEEHEETGWVSRPTCGSFI
jgi:hypothetical protein